MISSDAQKKRPIADENAKMADNLAPLPLPVSRKNSGAAKRRRIRPNASKRITTAISSATKRGLNSTLAQSTQSSGSAVSRKDSLQSTPKTVPTSSSVDMSIQKGIHKSNDEHRSTSELTTKKAETSVFPRKESSGSSSHSVLMSKPKLKGGITQGGSKARNSKSTMIRKPGTSSSIIAGNSGVGTTLKNSKKLSLGTKKGSSIAIGASVSRGVSAKVSSKHIVPATNTNTIADTTERRGHSNSDANTIDDSINKDNALIEKEDTIAYQHLGQLDPAWNIQSPKKDEKTMKDFCTKFKLPKNKKSKNNDGDENPRTEGLGDVREGSQANERSGGGGNKNKITDVEEEKAEDTRSGPLVEIINGEIVIKESSIIVGGRQTTEEVDREMEGSVVVEDNTGITATYNSFVKRYKSQHWSVQETRKFYLLLRQCGTDFSTMEQMFETEENPRTRRQLKKKYLLESRKNPQLIDMAMNPSVQIPLDLSHFGELDIEKISKVESSTAFHSAETSNVVTIECPETISGTENQPVKEADTKKPIEPNCLYSEEVATNPSPEECADETPADSGNVIDLENKDAALTGDKVEDDTDKTAASTTEKGENHNEKELGQKDINPIGLLGKKNKLPQRPKFRAKARRGGGKTKGKKPLK